MINRVPEQIPEEGRVWSPQEIKAHFKSEKWADLSALLDTVQNEVRIEIDNVNKTKELTKKARAQTLLAKILNRKFVEKFKSRELERALQTPINLPRNMSVIYKSADRRGGADGYTVDVLENDKEKTTEITLFDAVRHGKEERGFKALIYRAWEKIRKEIPEKNWYIAMEYFLGDVRERFSLGAIDTVLAIGGARLTENNEGKKLEILSPAAEIYYILYDKDKDKIWCSNSSATSLMKFPEGTIPSHKMLLGVQGLGDEDDKEADMHSVDTVDVVKSLGLSNNWELVILSDGLQGARLSTMPSDKRLCNKSELGDETFFEIEMRKIYQDESNTDEAWEKLLKRIGRTAHTDDITVVRLFSSYRK